MKKVIFVAVMLLLTARVAHGVPPFKSYSFANYGSPFFYAPTTVGDLDNAINGGEVNQAGIRGGTLNGLLQVGPTSVSDEYDPGVGLHVAFSAAAVYSPATSSNAVPGIGAKVSASNSTYIGSNTVTGENYVYLIQTVDFENLSGFDKIAKRYDMTVSLDGVVNVSGDAVVQVGAAARIGRDNGTKIIYDTKASIQTFHPGLGGLSATYNFGQPGLFQPPPITVPLEGLYGSVLVQNQVRTLTFETLLYVRAQTGVTDHAAGSASADFSNTLRVSNIRFYDENDQVIPGLKFTGPDGEVYPYNVVPEPSMLALLGVGSIGLLCARFRRMQRS